MKLRIIRRISFVITMTLSLRSSSQSLAIVLRVNDNGEVIVYRDEPLLLTLSITNQLAQENSRWNKAADRRLNELEDLLRQNKISREEYDKEKTALESAKRPVSAITIGDAGTPWPSLVKWKLLNKNTEQETVIELRKMIIPPSDEIAVLNEKGYYTAYFGIDANEMKKIPPGSYKIMAEFANEESQPADLTIRNESMPASFADSEENLLNNGRYWWHAGNANRGMQYTDRLLQKDQTSLDGLSLKGDLYVLTNSFLPALESYNKALKEFYRQNPGLSEPPEYLIAMIDWIKTQLR